MEGHFGRRSEAQPEVIRLGDANPRVLSSVPPGECSRMDALIGAQVRLGDTDPRVLSPALLALDRHTMSFHIK
jgi:hypothetical protein